MSGSALLILTKNGLLGGFRMAHVVFAIMWMGLLWFFNVVQVPAFAQMDPAARNNTLDKLSWRALWWFRWAAAFTLISGLFIIAIGGSDVYSGDFWKSPTGMGLATAILFAIIMAANVWMVIWPNQQIVIANARAVQEGKEANPDAAAAGRKGAMASRQNTIFSFSVIMFMVGTSHFFGLHFDPAPAAGKRVLFYLVALAIAGVMEANALGKLGGTGTGGTRAIYDTHQAALWTAGGLALFFYLFFEVFFRL